MFQYLWPQVHSGAIGVYTPLFLKGITMSEQIVADVMMGRISQELGMSRISCHTVASRQGLCHCGKILDQRTITAVTVVTPKRRVVQGFCPTCWELLSAEIKSAIAKTGTPCQIETWNASERFHGFTEGAE